MPAPEILVVGSINVDLLLFQPRLAAKGETLCADGFREEFGGKGANQAVQASRLGRNVGFIGAIGRDERGQASARKLRGEGIDCRLAVADLPTGLGVVNVLPYGEVHATIVPGANQAVTPAWVRANAALFGPARIVLLQNEVSAEANAEAVHCATRAGARVLYNAAPARPADSAITRACDYFIVNEEEAALFLGYRPETAAAMAGAAEELRELCSRVIVTMGASGSVIATSEGTTSIPAVPVEAVDTTGAGDAYVGAFAAALNRGDSPLAATRFASRVAAMATRSTGGQTGMPTIAQVARYSTGW